MDKQMRRSQGQDRITGIWAAGWTGFDGRGSEQPRPLSDHTRRTRVQLAQLDLPVGPVFRDSVAENG